MQGAYAGLLGRGGSECLGGVLESPAQDLGRGFRLFARAENVRHWPRASAFGSPIIALLLPKVNTFVS
jgi:hypothetical protein